MENSTFIQQYRYHLIGGGIFLAALTGVVIWQVRRKRRERLAFSPSVAPQRPAGGATGFCKYRDYPLRYGSCHPDVLVLQRALKALGADLGSYGPKQDGVDGKFGEKTRAALKAKFGRETVSEAEMGPIKARLAQWEGGR